MQKNQVYIASGEPQPLVVYKDHKIMYENIASKVAVAATMINNITDDQNVNPLIDSGLTTCGEIFCDGDIPVFRSCQKPCGIVTCLFCGSGLEFCCCYGCSREDCCQVCLTGFSMNITSPFIIGVIYGCAVGNRMLNNAKQYDKDDLKTIKHKRYFQSL